MNNHVISSKPHSPFLKGEVHEFAFDPTEVSHSEDAVRYIESLLAAGHDFSVTAYNESSLLWGEVGNDILTRVATR
jgi:hypothetical protein